MTAAVWGGSARTACTNLLKQAARAWQWRRVALHEGYEGLDRGAVFAPLFARAAQPTVNYAGTSLLAVGGC